MSLTCAPGRIRIRDPLLRRSFRAGGQSAPVQFDHYSHCPRVTAEDLFDCLFWLGPGTPRGRLHSEGLSAVTFWPEPDASACCIKDQLRVDADPGFAGPERRPVADELQRPAWWQRPGPPPGVLTVRGATPAACSDRSNCRVLIDTMPGNSVCGGSHGRGTRRCSAGRGGGGL